MADELAFWRAVGLVRIERAAGLVGLEECFAGGSLPTGVDRHLRGRLLATTCGWPFDSVLEGLARVWLPWWGTELSGEAGPGTQLFTPSGRLALRLAFPGYEQVTVGADGMVAALGFETLSAPSLLDPSVEVLRIDHRGVETNPAWPVRRVVSELVEVADGLHLGQALLDWRGRLRRAAWFSLGR